MNRISILMLLIAMVSCDESRLYEKNVDFENGAWIVTEKPEFEFEVADTAQTYNLYCNFRNSLTYPYARLFITYYLRDSTGKIQQQKLVNTLVFDASTGEPKGSSGLGDIYDHRFLLLKNHRFGYRGTHRIQLEQFMRKDTLDGVLAVGIRVEKNLPQ